MAAYWPLLFCTNARGTPSHVWNRFARERVVNPISKLTPSRWMEAIKSTSPRTVTTGPIRVAVIGCGTVAQTAHLPLLRRLGDFAIVGIADTDPAMLAAATPIAKRARQTMD